MKLAGKNRRIPRGVRWKLEDAAETMGKLPPEERAWYEKFLAEYVLDDDRDAPDAIHKTEEHKRSNSAALRAAQRDIVGAHPEAIEHAQEARDGNPRGRSTYGAEDYVQSAASPEAALAEALMPKTRRAGQPRKAAERKKQQALNLKKSAQRSGVVKD